MTAILTLLATKTAALAAAGLIVWGLLTLFRCRDSRLAMFCWSLVLLLGIVGGSVPGLSLPADRFLGKNLPQTLPSVSVSPVPQTTSPRFQTGGTVRRDSSSAAAPQHVAPARTGDRIAAVLFYLWIGGIGMILLVKGIAAVRLYRELARSEKPGEPFSDEWTDALREFGLSENDVEILLTETIGPSLVWRPFQKGAVAVPKDFWLLADAPVRSGVLRHELAHRRRHDFRRLLPAKLIALLHWFNPVAFLAASRLEEGAERLSDAEAFGRDADGAIRFVESILTLYKTTPSITVFQNSFGRSGFLRRIESLRHIQNSTKESVMKKILLTAAVITVAAFGIVRIAFVSGENSGSSTRPENDAAPAGKTQADAAPTDPIPCRTHLQKIVLAFHRYLDFHGVFPPECSVDADGKPLHSWRVLILPFLELDDLYQKIRLDEPWDSEYNKPFHAQMPEIYRCSKADLPAGMTVYSLIVGEGSVFQEPGVGVRLDKITDGLSNTLAVTERKTPVCWMDPLGDIDLAAAKANGINSDSPDGIGSGHRDGVWAGCFDGTVRSLLNSDSVSSPKAFEAILTPSGGESSSFDLDEYSSMTRVNQLGDEFDKTELIKDMRIRVKKLKGKIDLAEKQRPEDLAEAARLEEEYSKIREEARRKYNALCQEFAKNLNEEQKDDWEKWAAYYYDYDNSLLQSFVRDIWENDKAFRPYLLFAVDYHLIEAIDENIEWDRDGVIKGGDNIGPLQGEDDQTRIKWYVNRFGDPKINQKREEIAERLAIPEELRDAEYDYGLLSFRLSLLWNYTGANEDLAKEKEIVHLLKARLAELDALPPEPSRDASGSREN